MKTILREILLFVLIFIFVAFIIHIDRWLQNPVGHALNIFHHGLPWPPLFFSIGIYIVLLILRKFFSFAIQRK